MSSLWCVAGGLRLTVGAVDMVWTMTIRRRWCVGVRQEAGCALAPASCSLVETADGGTGLLTSCKHGQVKLSALW